MDDLMNSMAQDDCSVILTGSAGTSKSVFQYILLHHLLTNDTGE
jgi:hypothetical protein